MSLTICLILPALLVAVVLASVWLDRWSVPFILVALGTGIMCGSDVLNLWHFDDIKDGPRIRDLSLPEGAIITLITRGDQVVLPKGETRLHGWDHVTVLAHAPDEDKIREMLVTAFHRAEDRKIPIRGDVATS